MYHSYFSQPFNKARHSNAIPSRDNSSRRRKRPRRDSDDVLDDPSSELFSNTISKGSPDGRIASPPPSRAQQLQAHHEANEQVWNLGILGKNFPHVKPRNAEDSESDVESELQEALGGPKPRLLFQSRGSVGDVSIPDVSKCMNFRQQHLAALTAILHKCILEGDYIRAGRAWGILLRTEARGQPMDVRTHDRWGLGVEILCRRRLQPTESTSRQQGTMTFEDDSTLLNSKQWFSSEGFEKARGYYERLILQYPYQKTLPGAVSALDFYPAMFGLWIYSEQEQYELSLKSLREADINPAQELSEPAHTGERNPSPRPQTEAHVQEEDINKAFLRRGQNISTRLNELLGSPPFSDSTRLRDLQRAVNRWIEDFPATTFAPESKPDFLPEQGQLSTSIIDPTQWIEEPQQLHMDYTNVKFSVQSGD